MSIELSFGGYNRPFFARTVDRFRRAFARWNEAQRLDSHQMEAIAHELNLSKDELNTLMFTPADAVEALNKCLSHVGITESELAVSHGDVLRDMRRVCSQCTHQERCIRDLKHERRAMPARYCPNEQTLRAMACEKRQDTAQILPFTAA